MAAEAAEFDMSYLVLARKWRPRDFSETVGQEHVLKALINALDSGRLHHAYLFGGTRGFRQKFNFFGRRLFVSQYGQTSGQ